MSKQDSIKFKKLELGSIFKQDFRNFTHNNIICFSEQGLAVVYGPNGTGKTSFINVLSGKQNSSFLANYQGVDYAANSDDLFYIINDQNHRNIISGSARDFFIAANIQREFDLIDFLIHAKEQLVTSVIDELKKNFNITSSSSKTLEYINNSEVKSFLGDCANSKSKGKKFSIEQILEILRQVPVEEIPDIDPLKWTFITSDIGSKESLIKKLIELPLDKVVVNPQIHEIEENSDALYILEKFPQKTQCIVCDNEGIDCESLHQKKEKNKEAVIASFDKNIREAVLQVIQLTGLNDPFDIKGRLMNAVDTGSVSEIVKLQKDFSVYLNVFNNRLVKMLKDILVQIEAADKVEEYNRLIRERPEISEEDMLYIEEIISSSMGKDLRLTRDVNKTIKLQLANSEFLGVDRDSLPLSTGEQNFLSLTFEFLKAKNSACKIVVLDDPISSFDSIYKNKIAYAIMKILQNKKRIILTHNTDLLRLLESQFGSSYSLYILNNTQDEDNGFIALKQNEKGMLINLATLLDTFRKKIFPYIRNMEYFLISMIPFCRGYATLIDDTTSINELTNVMHGYKTKSVDIAAIYRKLFNVSDSTVPASLSVSVEEILHKSVDMIDIVDTVEYPLLNKTLKHSFTYLQLRLLVEKSLVNRYTIDVKPNMQLGQIINAAFPDDHNPDSIRHRVRLTSKKTLINEFNHFEGNLSIFQPAIDITNTALNDEKNSILNFIETVNSHRI